jgi:flagellar biosynthesis chaperone FliJ
MALKVKIKKDKDKYNIYACTVDGIDETPLNYAPYETEQHALASAIYKGYDVDDELPKPKKTNPIKNQEVPRVKHEKPKEMDLGKEREIKLENLVRRIYNEIKNSSVKFKKNTISELDITDPTLVAELETMADLAEKMDRMKAELSALTAQFKPLDEKFTAMLDAIDENKERVLRTKNVLVTIKKKGYEAESIKYKELFEALYGKINGKLKKIANDMKTAATTIKKVSSSIATQKLNSESKLNEGMLSNLWNKVKNYITSFTSKIKQQGQSVDADLEKLEKLSLK